MKKQYMNYMKSCLLVMIACLVSMVGAAQGFSPAAMEQLKTRRLWSHSQNAAGMPFDDIQNYSNVILGYDLQDGNYCRPQEGQKETIVGVSSEGFINLKNAYVWGAFNFAQKNLTDAGYNASIADPFRGMPYYVADQHLSKWRNQYYDLKFRAATPLLGCGGACSRRAGANRRFAHPRHRAAGGPRLWRGALNCRRDGHIQAREQGGERQRRVQNGGRGVEP